MKRIFDRKARKPAPVPASINSQVVSPSSSTRAAYSTRPLGSSSSVSAATAHGNGIPLIWHDPWRSIVAGGFQYAAIPVHPGESWSYAESLVARARLDELGSVPAAGTLALEALRIEAWRPRAATEIDGTTIPHELDWLRSAVHLSKGCYRGQETVAKVHNLGHPPRRMALLHLDGSEGVLPEAGDEVLLDGAVVGRVDRALQHGQRDRPEFVVQRGDGHPAAALTVATSSGEVLAAAQQVIVPPDAGAEANVPRLPRVGAVRR
jgi:hypothetical protein